MTSFGRVPSLLVICLALSATGCGKIAEIRACRSLSQDVNPVLDEIEALSKSKAPDRELRMAKHYGELSKRLTSRATGSTALANAVREYATLLASTDGALRAHAEATKANNGARMAETRRELERLVKRERAAIARIGVECKA
jgi:LmbE family N-acetylglucosaminyl deacetylase